MSDEPKIEIVTGDAAVHEARGEKVLRNAGMIPDEDGNYARMIELTPESLKTLFDTLGPVVRAADAENEGYRSGEGERWAGYLTGNCPVQGYGEIDGDLHWYFRARYDGWSLGIGASPDDAVDGKLFEAQGPYGEMGGYDAGWMPYKEAWPLIEAAIAKWREHDDS